MPEKEYVFVYGTLKKNQSNSYLMDPFHFEGNAQTLNKYQMYEANGGSFPFILKSQQNNTVNGELYSTSDPLLLIDLDEYESFPHLYLKEQIIVKTENGEKIKAWIYYKNEAYFKDYIDLNKPILEW